MKVLLCQFCVDFWPISLWSQIQTTTIDHDAKNGKQIKSKAIYRPGLGLVHKKKVISNPGLHPQKGQCEMKSKVAAKALK